MNGAPVVDPSLRSASQIRGMVEELGKIGDGAFEYEGAEGSTRNDQ